MQGVSGDRGQAAPLIAAVMAIGCVMVMGLGQLGIRAGDVARARTAADAAALAGAAEGPYAAATYAAGNGGTLVAFVEGDGAVTVTVRVGAATATARVALLAEGERPEVRRGMVPVT